MYQAKEITKKLLYIYYYNTFTIKNYYTFTIHGKIFKTSCKNTNFKISAPTWNEELELPDRSYSISDTQDYFKHIFKNMRQLLTILQ